MPGTKYVVDIEFRQSGEMMGGAEGLKGKLGEVRGEATKVGATFREFGGSLIHGFTGAVEKVGGMMLDLGKVGAATGMAGITYGVAGLNKELETTEVSLGAVLNANNKSKDIADGMEQASKWIGQMKKDARDLPGEFEDLLGIVQSSAGSAFKLGMDVPAFEKLASSAMAAGKALQVPLDQAGRELAMLMEGRAGSHNTLGNRLGISAHALYKDLDGASKKFSELTDAGRVKVLEEKIGAFEPAIKAFGNTFDAQWSTAVDNGKNVLGILTKELFGRVVNDLRDINTWFEEHRGDVEAFAKEVGHKLVDAHDAARKIIEEWGPVLKEFASNAYDKFVEMWRDAAPYVKEIAEHVKEFLKDKESIDKLVTLGKIYVGLKVGETVNSGPLGKLASGLMAGEAGAGAAAGGLAGAGGAGAGATVAAGAAALLALVGVAAAAWQANELGNDVAGRGADRWRVDMEMAQNLSNQQDGRIDYDSQAYKQTLLDAAVSSRNLKDTFDHLFVSLSHWDLDAFTTRTADAAVALQDFAIGLQNTTVDMAATMQQMKDDKATQQMDEISKQAWAMANQMANNFNAGKKPEDDAKRKKDAAAGRATVNIAKVEMTISNNNAPGQVAREVMREIANVRRYRTSSPGVTNFSTLPPGT